MGDNGRTGATTQYEVVKQQIDQSFPRGHFVAVEHDKIIADAKHHRQILEKLRVQGKSPRGMLIVQAGVDYPESAVIFLTN
jgi:hypothetical protein